MRTRDVKTSGRSRVYPMPHVNASTTGRGVSGSPRKESETAHSNEKNESQSAYNSPTSRPASENGISQHGGSHPDQMSIPCCQLSRSAECERLETASQLPPVTKSNLSELDLSWIMHNISLRVDVNYDHDLHFMPIQGPSGEQKRQGAKNYWLALAAEFRIYQHNLIQCPVCQVIGEQPSRFFKPRLPDMFRTLRELLETLVPDRDHSRIVENLDIPLLMQQIEKGVLDIVRLSQWIAELLKSHCAPMRDEWADEMASRVEEGCLLSDMDVIVDGLEKLFSFLEAMKLDVANHQIRTFRFPLIEDTVPFQQNYFSRKLREKKISPHASRIWYQKARGHHQKCLSGNEQELKIEPLGALIHGILRQCTEPQHMPEFPETFAYDRLRLNQLREDVQDIIYLHICVEVFKKFVEEAFADKRIRPESHTTLQGRIITLIENDDSEPRCDRWQGQIEDVAMEITRAAYAEYGLEHLPIADCEFECTTRLLEGAFRKNFSSLANELHAKLEQLTLIHASKFQDQSPLHISEAQKHWQQSRQDDKLWQADPEDIARRIAHMAVLHWRVWAGLVYLEGEESKRFESEPGMKENSGTDGQNQLLLGSGGEVESESGELLAADQISPVGDCDGNT